MGSSTLKCSPAAPAQGAAFTFLAIEIRVLTQSVKAVARTLQSRGYGILSLQEGTVRNTC